LDRHLRLVRLPDKNPHCQLSLERIIPLNSKGDNPCMYVLHKRTAIRPGQVRFICLIKLLK